MTVSMEPLTAAEEAAAQARQQERLNALRARGWHYTRPITRAAVADWTLDRWLLRNPRRDA